MELTIDQILQQGIAAHKEGELESAERLYRVVLQSQPTHSDANHNLGVIAVAVNKVEEALPLFKTALEANPKIEQFWISYIGGLIKVKQFETAERVLADAVRMGLSGEKVDALGVQINQTAQATGSEPIGVKQQVRDTGPPQTELKTLLEHFQNGRYDAAEALALSMTKEFPDYQLSWTVLGAVLKQTGRLPEAIDANRRAVDLDPQDAAAYYNLGVTLQELGNLEEAEASYGRAVSLNPDYAEAHNNLGVTLKDLGRLEEAAASYRWALKLKSDFAEAHNNLGITVQELGRLEEAEASYRQAIELKPEYSEAHYNLANTLRELGCFGDAESNYRQAIALKPDNVPAHYNLGNSLQELGRLEEAEASYRQAIELKPDYAEALYNLGVVLQARGRLDEAEASYRQAIELKPDYAEALYNLGVVLQARGRLDEAEASFRQAIELKPDYAEAHNNLAATLQEFGRLEEAEASYRQAIALKPDFSLAHSNLGSILYINGDVDAAIERFEKTNDIDPELKSNELLLRVVRAKKARRETGLNPGNATRPSDRSGLSSNPLILNRAVEAELIAALYEMNSRELDKTPDTRFGNGRCSPDYNMFNDDRLIIKTVANDLINMMELAVKSEVYVYDSFFNIYGAGAGITPHAHLNKVDKEKYFNLEKQKYSLVYYLDIGDQDCSEPGILTLYDPEEEILPCEGMIVTFPAGRHHSAVYGGKKDRVMIGANFYSL